MPDWFAFMLAAYLVALAMWGLAVREARKNGGWFPLLVTGWAFYGIGLAVCIVGLSA